MATRKRQQQASGGGGGFIVLLIIIYLVIHLSGGGYAGSATCRHLEHLWVRAGGTSSAIYAADVAMAESSGQDVENPQPCAPGSNAIGYWQICMPLNAKYVPGGDAYNGLANAKAAVTISGDGSNWGPWPDPFTAGQVAGQCG